jgi:hypothetical protein
MTTEREDMILMAITSLRTELGQRMDRQDAARENQWKAIQNLQMQGCSKGPQHETMEARLKALELDRAKMMGVVVTIAAVISFAGWLIERVWTK